MIHILGIFVSIILLGLMISGQEMNSITISLVENGNNSSYINTIDNFLQEPNNRLYLPSTSINTRLYLYEDNNYFQNYIGWCKDVQEGTSTFVSVSHCPNPALLQSMAYHAEIPLVTFFPSRCSHKSLNDYVLDFPAMYGNVADILHSLIERQKWKEIIIIYDASVGDQPWLDQLLSRITGVTYSLLDIDIAESLERALTTFYRPTEYAIPYLLLCSNNSTKKILYLAQGLQLRRLEYTWIIYHEETSKEDIIPDLLQSDNIAIIDTSSEKSEQDYNNMQDLSDSLVQAYSTVLNQSLWEKPNTQKNGCRSPLSKTLRDTILANIAEQLAEKTCDNKNCTTTEYDIHSSLTQQDGNPQFVPVGAWKSDQTLESYNDLFPNAFNGFNNRTFTVVSLEYSFFQQKVPTGNGTYRWDGLSFELLNELAKELNFSYNVVEPPDMGWGIETGNGTWNGMIGEVMNKKVDFAAAGFSVTAARESVIDFASPYFRDESVVIINRPSDDNRLSLYLQPLKWQVWMSIIAAIVFCGLLLWAITKYNPYYYHPGVNISKNDGFFLPNNALLYTFGAMCQQGGVWLPVTQSGRIIVGAYWFFVLVMAATYTGNLIAFLAVSTLQMPFDDLQGMVHQSEYSWGTDAAVALFMLFRDANFEPYTSVFDRIDTSPSYGAAMKRVKEGKYAFIAEKSFFASASASDCNLATIKQVFYPTNYAWALQTNSPYKQLFNDKIDKFREAGILERWIQKWTPKNLHCKGLGPVTNAKVATLRDFQGAFIVLSIGVFTALLFLSLEFLYRYFFKLKHRRLKKETVENDLGDTISEHLPDDIEKMGC